MLITSTLFAILSYVGWGIGDVISIRVFRSNDAGAVTFYSALYRIFIWLLLLPFFYAGYRDIALVPLLFNLLAGFSSGFGYYFFGKAAKSINPSLVAAISGGWGGVALIFSLLFFHEVMTLPQWLSVALIFLGLFFTTFNLNWLKKLDLNAKGFRYAIFSLILWGACGAFLKIPALSYGWYWTSIILLLPYLLIVKLTTSHRVSIFTLKLTKLKWFFVMVVLMILADMGYSMAFQWGGNIAIIGTIAGSSATLSTLLAYFVYKEPLKLNQKVGIALSLLGIIATAYFSSI